MLSRHYILQLWNKCQENVVFLFTFLPCDFFYSILIQPLLLKIRKKIQVKVSTWLGKELFWQKLRFSLGSRGLKTRLGWYYCLPDSSIQGLFRLFIVEMTQQSYSHNCYKKTGWSITHVSSLSSRLLFLFSALTTFPFIKEHNASRILVSRNIHHILGDWPYPSSSRYLYVWASQVAQW